METHLEVPAPPACRRRELCQTAVEVGRRGEQEGGVCGGDGLDRVPEIVAGISGRTMRRT